MLDFTVVDSVGETVCTLDSKNLFEINQEPRHSIIDVPIEYKLIVHYDKLIFSSLKRGTTIFETMHPDIKLEISNVEIDTVNPFIIVSLRLWR